MLKLYIKYAKINKKAQRCVVKIILDRVSKDQSGKIVAVFEVEDNMVTFKDGQMPKEFAENLIPNAIVECEIVDGCIVNPVILYEETKQRENEMKELLNQIFGRKS